MIEDYDEKNPTGLRIDIASTSLDIVYMLVLECLDFVILLLFLKFGDSKREKAVQQIMQAQSESYRSFSLQQEDEAKEQSQHDKLRRARLDRENDF